jgi:PAS domain S-box-containing protein
MSSKAHPLTPADYYELSYSITRLLAAGGGIHDSKAVILDLLGRKLGWEFAAWWVVDELKIVLRCCEVWYARGLKFPHFTKVSLAREFSFGEGLPGMAWSSRRPVHLPDVTAHPNFPRASVAKMDGLHTGVACPIYGNNAVLAVIEGFRREQQPNADPNVIDFLRALGGQIGVFVERSRALEELDAISAQFRHVTEAASEAIFTIDESSTILFANSAVQGVLGYKPEELVGQKLTVIIPERLRSQHEHGIRRYVETGQRNLSWSGVLLPGLHKDGHEVPLEISFAEFYKMSKRVFTGFARPRTTQTGHKGQQPDVRFSARRSGA